MSNKTEAAAKKPPLFCQAVDRNKERSGLKWAS